MNPKIDAYLGRAQKWQEEIAELRAILLACHLTEELKWGKPCYAFQGSNIVLIVPFKEYCALLFPRGALLGDPAGILIQPTENTQSARQIRFTDAHKITELESTLKSYVDEAVAAQKSGRVVDYKSTSEFALPEELQTQLARNPSLKTAFEALTPGRQRGYILHFSAPKQSKTRDSRVAKCMQQILDGKGLNDR